MDFSGKFYYSRQAADLPHAQVNKCLLTDGRIEQYTEWVGDGGKPLSKWDDLEYLGEGIIYWHNGVDQVTPKQVREWTMRRRLALACKYIAWASICFAVLVCILFCYAYLKG